MSYFWNFGSRLGICLRVQIITGIIITFHYTSYSEEAFNSIIKIIQERWITWLWRITHINGASTFFVMLYIHMFRGIYFLRYTRKKTWISGVTILLTIIAISFLGYVLPWGQISYWAVAVITNLLSIIPLIGKELVIWIWGRFSVRAPTLNRFYSLHFILPIVLRRLVLRHLVILHKRGSSNNLNTPRNIEKIPFQPFFRIKDLSFILTIYLIIILITTITPYLAGDPLNFIPANPIQTPTHIQPEWYFLTSYAILRAMPSKIRGVISLLISILLFYTYPLFKFKFSIKFNKIRKIIFWTLAAIFLTLIKLGSIPAEQPYINIRKIIRIAYFTIIIIINI